MIPEIALAAALEGGTHTAFSAGAINTSVHRTIAQRCERIARPTKYVLQLADVLQTQARMRKYGYLETDALSSKFGARNPFAAALGALTVDVLGDALSHKSPMLRCALDARDIETSVNGILLTAHSGAK